jgi:hypothetical protein
MIYYENVRGELQYYYIRGTTDKKYCHDQYIHDENGCIILIVSEAYLDELPELSPIYLEIKNEEI